MSNVNLLGRETAERRRAKSGQYSARIVRNRTESSVSSEKADVGMKAKSVKGMVAKGRAGTESAEPAEFRKGTGKDASVTNSEDSQNFTSDDAYFERISP